MTSRELWENTDVFIIDIDGTFRKGTELVDKASEFIDFICKNGKQYLFFTNNSSCATQVYAEEFAEKGCIVDVDNIMSTADVSVYYLKKNYPDQEVYVVGTDSLITYLRRLGISVGEQEPAVVLTGFDTTFTYDKMKKASNFIRAGATFVATHLDVNCPIEEGVIPDCGSICASIEKSSGVKPVMLGKPSKQTMEMIEERTKKRRERITFVGDRLSTDIAVGFYHGANTCLVLGGASTVEEVKNSEVKPDYIADSLGDLYHSFQKEISCE